MNYKRKGNCYRRTNHGICEIRTEEQRQKALANFEIGDVWGIGRRAKAKLTAAGVTTALQFADKPSTFAKGLLNKPGLLRTSLWTMLYML